MVWSPSGSEEVVTVATPFETETGSLGEAPTKGEPFSVKVTVPVLPTPPVIEAVNVTDWPKVAFTGLELTLVVVAVPELGVIVRHHPALGPLASVVATAA